MVLLVLTNQRIPWVKNFLSSKIGVSNYINWITVATVKIEKEKREREGKGEM